MTYYSIAWKNASMPMGRDEGHLIVDTISGKPLTRNSVDAAAIPGAFVRHDGLIAVGDSVRAQQLVSAMNSGPRLPAPGERKYCSTGGYYFGTCRCYFCNCD